MNYLDRKVFFGEIHINMERGTQFGNILVSDLPPNS